MSTTTNTPVLDQETTTAAPAPSTTAQASNSHTIHLSSQSVALNAILGYMTGLSEMMNSLQEMLNDRLKNQWDYIEKNYNDMKDQAEDQFKATMSSAVGTIAGGAVTLGSSIGNGIASRDLNNQLKTQQAEKAQLEKLDSFLRGGRGADENIELGGGNPGEIEMDDLNPANVPALKRDAILDGLRKENGGDFTDEALNSQKHASHIRSVWNDEVARPDGERQPITPPEKAQILKRLDDAIARKNQDIKATQTELQMKQESWYQGGKAAEALLNAGGSMGQAFWGRDAKMDERDSMLHASVEKSMEQAAQNAEGSIKTFANQLSSLADALQKVLYVQQRA